MKIPLFPVAAARSVPAGSWLIILLLPCVNLVSGFLLRDHAGPFWLWSNLDPDYWYLLDSLNIINLNWPVHIAHPGTPLQVLGAGILKLAHPLASAEQITQLVLANPERYLHLINAMLVLVNTAAMIFIGLCGYLVFSDRLVIVLLQIAPFISKLSIKWMTHVAPEPLLVAVVLVAGGVALLALRPASLAQNRHAYAITFGVIAGFGMATKITSVGIYFLPVFLLWSPPVLFTYAATAVVSALLFTLPAAGSYGDLLSHINNISVGSEHLGEIRKPFIDVAEYPRQLIRVSSRPAFFIVLLASLLMLGYLGFQSKFRARPFPLAARLLAGLCLADLVQALIVAKHPSGHYMIPVLVLSTLGLTLLYRLLVDIRVQSGSSHRPVQGVFAVLAVGLIVAQTITTVKLDRQFQVRASMPLIQDDRRFDKCARIFFWSASSPSYALQLGNFMVGNPFSAELGKLRPANDYWYMVNENIFRDWSGPRDIRDIAAGYPCIYARGTKPVEIIQAFQEFLPGHTFSTHCSAAIVDETILTSGVDCQGALK